MHRVSTSSGFLCSEAGERAQNIVALRQRKLSEDALNLLAEDVIVRLAGRHTASISVAAPPSEEELDALCDALISSDADAGLALVTEYQERGITPDALYLGYVAGAARRLGERWDTEQISIVDVSIGASRLYVIMSALRPTLLSGRLPRKTMSHALFASTPGETHTLGVTMAADLFRSRGWEIDLRTDLQHNELVSEIGHDRYKVIGLSASSEKSIFSLTRLISSLRVSSPLSSILLSGELASIEPDLALLVDADSIAIDANSAIGEMQRLLDVGMPTAAQR